MDPPQVTSNNPSQHKDKVIDLIALLDRYLYLTVAILAPGRELQPSDQTRRRTSPSPLDSEIPIALQTYPPIPLSSHLQAQENDIATAHSLEQRIRLIHSLATPVVLAAHARLKAEYAACTPTPSQPDIQNFAFKSSLTDKLATLRAYQHNNPPEHQLPSFEVVVVKSLDDIGNIADMTVIDLPKGTDWPYFHLALQRTTICSQTESAGYPTGYTLRAGAWLIQPTKHNHPVSSAPTYTLRTASDFRTLRAYMTSDASMGALVWHEKLWTRSRRLRDEARKKREKMAEWTECNLEGEVEYETGELYFEPGFGEELNWDDVQFDIEGLVDPALRMGDVVVETDALPDQG